MNIEITPEYIADYYTIAMQCVKELNAGKPAEMTLQDWGQISTKYKIILREALIKDFWTTENLRPFSAALEN